MLKRRAKPATRRQIEEHFEDWMPTVENKNRLPKPLRDYIADLETLCDPAGIVRENSLLKRENRALQRLIAERKGISLGLSHNPRQVYALPPHASGAATKRKMVRAAKK
jgi:hypothetical protein